MNFIENETADKLRGGYYTDPGVARYLSRWALADGAMRVLEPSCGDGAFIDAIGSVAARPVEVEACEIVGEEAAKARSRGAAHARASVNIVQDDFLSWAHDAMERGTAFDAAVGNPPYIRYQYLSEIAQRRAAAIFERLDLPFTRHTNAWVPFVLASLALLRPGGRLAMVVPAELLHILHAQPLRAHLLRTCGRILVLDPEELIFSDALQGVVLLLAERGQGGAVRVESVPKGAELPDAELLLRAGVSVDGSTLGRKWTQALLSPTERALLADLEARPGFVRFAEIAAATVGIVTGANRFFLVPDEVVEAHGLGEFAHPMFGRSEHVPGVLYDTAQHERNRRVGRPTNFLWFRADHGKPSLAPEVRAYIEEGEAEGLHTRYKCRTREPWYAVPHVSAAPVAMLKRSHDFPRLVLNERGAFTTDTAYRVRPEPGVHADVLVSTFVNSLTALSAELEGRHYGGGVLELVPSEIARVQLPPLGGDRSSLDALDRDVAGREFSAMELLERNDERVLRQHLGRGELDTIVRAAERLRRRRHRK